MTGRWVRIIPEQDAGASGPTDQPAPRYTPGPWSTFGPLRFTVYGGDPVRRIAVVDYTQGQESEESHANARAITLFPELVEALRALIAHDQAADNREGMPNCLELDNAVALLAKL